MREELGYEENFVRRYRQIIPRKESTSWLNERSGPCERQQIVRGAGQKKQFSQSLCLFVSYELVMFHCCFSAPEPVNKGLQILALTVTVSQSLQKEHKVCNVSIQQNAFSSPGKHYHSLSIKIY